MTTTMRAAVCVRAGGPEVLEIREVPVPAVRAGWSLVRVTGAGINRSELRTRQGHSPGVRFPRVLGIECVGVVADSTDPALPEGTTEFMCHPGICGDDLRSAPTRLKESREAELRALESPEVRAALVESNVNLATYRDLGVF